MRNGHGCQARPSGEPPLPAGLEPGGRSRLSLLPLTSELSLELLLVPAGPVELGRDDGARDERPRHVQVVHEPFWIARAPVTRGAWRAFARATGRSEPRRSWWPWAPGDDAPITGITWDDAQAFCAWTGMALPTEAEWERAATLRQAEPPPLVSIPAFPGGASAFPHLASTALLAAPAPRPGLLFVEGLGEWCDDRYSERAYMAYALGNLRPPGEGEHRLARTPRDGPRARWAHLPRDRAPTLGFRPLLRLPADPS